MLDAAKGNGLKSVQFFDNAAQAGIAIRSLAKSGDAILFKGSRGVHVEEALQPLVDSLPTPVGGGAK